MRRQHRRQVCDHCGGRFGMVTHRWWGHKFCKRVCKGTYIREVALNQDATGRWLAFARLPHKTRDRRRLCAVRSVKYRTRAGLESQVHMRNQAARGGAGPMIQIIFLFIALLLDPATAAKADARHCGHASELATARLRWQATRQTSTDPTQREKNCPVYGVQFYEAVTARQATSVCSDGIDHQRDLELLDSEIAAFNNLIAAQCGG